VRPYELTVLLHPDLEIDVDAPIAKIEKLVDAASGKIIKRDNWGKKRLAYPIRKQQFAVYVYFEISLEPEKVRQLEGQLLITEEVMRFLIVNRIEQKAKAEGKKPAKAKSEDKEPVAVAAEEESNG
jgi:small subunit ribosomal protein S6